MVNTNRYQTTARQSAKRMYNTSDIRYGFPAQTKSRPYLNIMLLVAAKVPFNEQIDKITVCIYFRWFSKKNCNKILLLE